MKSTVTVTEEIIVGNEIVIEDQSPTTQYAVVFEDDGETGYFYGLDTTIEDPILDALHIYNSEQVTDKHLPSTLQVLWSEDGLKAALIINQYPHAVFDFDARRGYCRSNFPPPDGNWTKFSHEWDDSARNLFL